MDDATRRDQEQGLELDEQSVSDIDVPEEDAEQAKGGMMPVERGGSVTGTGCRTTVSIRAGCTP